MDMACGSIAEGKPMNHHEFEEAVYEIVPSRKRAQVYEGGFSILKIFANNKHFLKFVK